MVFAVLVIFAWGVTPQTSKTTLATRTIEHPGSISFSDDLPPRVRQFGWVHYPVSNNGD